MDIARREVGPCPPVPVDPDIEPTSDEEIPAWLEARAIVHRHGRSVANLARKIRQAVRFEKRYPLIEWGWGRDECVKAIADAGLPSPGKSACFFCPSSKLHEIRALPRELLSRALAMEAGAADNTISVKGLGRSFAWRDAVAGETSAEPPISIPCECTDGDDE